MNYEVYPWLDDLDGAVGQAAIAEARQRYLSKGAVTLPHFLTPSALQACVTEARDAEDEAFTTNDTHTAYLCDADLATYPPDSVYNHPMCTVVASTAFDQLPPDSKLAALYRHPTLLKLVSRIVGQDPLYLSADPLGCCSINVFRPDYHHSFHFDESVFSTTLMLQEAEGPGTGLFQYTAPLRTDQSDLALKAVAATIQTHDQENPPCRLREEPAATAAQVPPLHTLDFRPGTLSIFSGSRSLHRVTRVEGRQSRLVAVLTYGQEPGFCNSAAVQNLFWGRSVQPEERNSKG